MVKTLVFAFLLLTSVSAYFRAEECLNITITLETHLLKMSLEFSSLAYFMNGYRDLQEAWAIFPSWLMNCIPFIVDPNASSYSFENIDEELLNAAVWENQKYLNENFSLKTEKFENCEEAIKSYYNLIRQVASQGEKEEYLGMIISMRSLGSIGKRASEVCGK